MWRISKVIHAVPYRVLDPVHRTERSLSMKDSRGSISSTPWSPGSFNIELRKPAYGEFKFFRQQSM